MAEEQERSHQPPPRRITGIGGVFFRAKDPAKLMAWSKTPSKVNTIAVIGTLLDGNPPPVSVRVDFTSRVSAVCHRRAGSFPATSKARLIEGYRAVGWFS